MGIPTLLSTNTADNDSELDITSNITSAYDEYMFVCTDIGPATDGATFHFQFNASGGSGFNETISSTAVRAYHQEDGSDAGVGYRTGEDQGNGTAFEIIMEGIHDDDDTGGSGMLTIYDPSSTTFVKHFLSNSNTTLTAGTKHDFHAGYINTTSAIDEISFKTSSGTMDSGTIKMFGVS